MKKIFLLLPVLLVFTSCGGRAIGGDPPPITELLMQVHADESDLYFKLDPSSDGAFEKTQDSYVASEGYYSMKIIKNGSDYNNRWKGESVIRLVVEQARREVALLELKVEGVHSEDYGRSRYTPYLREVTAIKGCTIDGFTPTASDGKKPWQSPAHIHISLNK